MKSLPFLIAALFASKAVLADGNEGSYWPPLQLRDVNLTYKRYVSEGRDEWIHPYVHREAVNLGVNTDVLRFGYWDSTVLSVTDQTQFRGVGLDTRLGLRAAPWLAVEFQHISKHVLEDKHSCLPSYPVYDSINVILTLYGSSPRPSLLK